MIMDKAKARSNGTCEVVCVDAKRVGAALKALPSDKLVNSLAETFRSLSDPTRVRILIALSKRELCVCDLASVLGLTGSAVSHQLRLLRGLELVKYRKDGKIAYYTLDDDHISNLLDECVRHVQGR